MAKKINSIKDILTQDFISDILATACYGNPWFSFGTHQDTPEELYQAAKDVTDHIEDKWAYILTNGGYLLVEDVEEEKEYKLSYKDIKKGFKILMLNYPSMYANLMEEQGDIYDADAVIQCSIFGEVVYG